MRRLPSAAGMLSVAATVCVCVCVFVCVCVCLLRSLSQARLCLTKKEEEKKKTFSTHVFKMKYCRRSRNGSAGYENVREAIYLLT